MLTELKIDPEFQNKIPPMPIEDFNGLREDILRDGYVRDPLTVWKEENILLDGHHRWKIIQENPEVLENKYTIDYRSFPNRFACIAWICANQIHRHNMTEPQRDYLIKEEYVSRQRSSGFQIGHPQYTSYGEDFIHHTESLIDGAQIPVVQTGKTPKTRQIMAKEHNVNEGVIQRAVEFGRGLDRAEEVEPGIKNDILSGALKANKKDIAEIRKLKDDDEVKEKIKEIREPKPSGSSKIKGFTKEARRDKKLLDEVVSDMYSPEKKEFTVEMLLGDIEINGEDYVNLLRNTLIERSTLLIGENRLRVVEKIDEIINKIQKLKELIK